MTAEKQSRRFARAGGAAVVLLAGLAIIAWALLEIALAAYPSPEILSAKTRGSGSTLALDRNGGLIAWRVDETGNMRIPVGIDEISDSLVNATIAAEDKRFLSHGGVDLIAVTRAVIQNVTSRRLVSGASTITMQVMRMTNPRARTFEAKGREAFRALQFERVVGKREILERYFNMAPYGGNTVGAEAASRRYFGKSASQLTLGEAALLAGVPQSPTRLNPRKRLDAALARREYVFGRMLDSGLASEREIETARRERIILVDSPHKTAAPHFADYVLQRRSGRGGVIRTTLDPEIQAAAMDAYAERARKLGEMNIDGLAVVVIGIKDSELLAMIGGADPSNPVHGQVNCATSPRQPGSLLKPFVYTAAFSTGAITPKSLLYDIPMSWRGYRPENMDRSYLGPIAADEALSLSRNIPAVDMLDRVGVFRLSNDANLLGLDIGGSEERCGLSLALGTAEVSLVDISNAYAALGRLGVYEPLRVDLGEPRERGRRVYPDGAAYLTIRSLGAPEPGQSPRPIWKTGTSWNNRDAWAVALTPDYVVGVWSGSYSGGGHPGLIGSKASLPLAIEIADCIGASGTETWEAPDNVRARTICALSGRPASAACSQLIEAEYIPGVSSEAPCRMHRYVIEDGKRKIVIAWPGKAAAFLPSRDKKGSADSVLEPAIEITSPGDLARYVMAGDSGPRDNLSFNCRTETRSASIYWFVDGELFAENSAAGAVDWDMTPGEHELIASMSDGTASQISFSVSQLQ